MAGGLVLSVMGVSSGDSAAVNGVGTSLPACLVLSHALCFVIQAGRFSVFTSAVKYCCSLLLLPHVVASAVSLTLAS